MKEPFAERSSFARGFKQATGRSVVQFAAEKLITGGELTRQQLFEDHGFTYTTAKRVMNELETQGFTVTSLDRMGNVKALSNKRAKTVPTESDIWLRHYEARTKKRKRA